MKARLLKKWGTNYAGQILTNVEKGSIPEGVAEFFEDNDPAVMTVVEQHTDGEPLMVVNDEINPKHAKAHAESQRASARASEDATNTTGVAGAIEKLEDEQTQERARHADKVAAERSDHKGDEQLSPGQRAKNAAGKGPADLKQGGKAKSAKRK
jgi:hypothetical protein